MAGVADRLTPRLREAVKECKARLGTHFGSRLHKVVLFGSYAWGTPAPDSDVDVCIVVDALTQRDRVQAIELVADVCIERLVDLSPIVFSTEQLSYDLSIEKALAEDIVQSGILV
jgi:predicted nucleotidyltransferase